MIQRWVTASPERITNGIPKDGCQCVIALAVKPLVSDDVFVTVAVDRIIYQTETHFTEIHNYIELGMFILNVDFHPENVFPMSFLIEIPEWALR